jgi:hypothetical protein
MTSKFIFSGVLVLLLSLTVKSQDCSDLLKQGLREYTKVITQTENYQQTSSAICEAYQEFKSSGDAGKANAKYKSIFKGSASYSKTQIEEIGKLYCEQNFALSTNGQYGEYQGSFIDPNYAQMYIACINASSKNVQLKLEPTDGKNESISITASYLSFSSNRPKVTGILYDTSKLEVEGELKKAAIEKAELNGFSTLIAKRKDLSNSVPYQVGNEMVLARSHQMTIQFENAAITIKFPAIYPNPPKLELIKGVGEIVASMLPVNKFLELYGKSEWALADGSKTPINSSYKLISETLPDLRGVFLRGKNYDKPTNLGNPEGDLELGTYREDLFKQHDHGVTIFNDKYPRSGGTTFDMWRNNRDARTTMEGGIETRPRNVTVNYFIKIN